MVVGHRPVQWPGVYTAVSEYRIEVSSIHCAREGVSCGRLLSLSIHNEDVYMVVVAGYRLSPSQGIHTVVAEYRLAPYSFKISSTEETPFPHGRQNTRSLHLMFDSVSADAHPKA